VFFAFKFYHFDEKPATKVVIFF